ncbi:MAG TPA: hypothetical protein IAC04_04215 [Candidatus Coprenecus stercoravium]|uniref:DNA polymerase III subunit delta n=1 Tax=Candidatus Coprenecus stercoravium TaxID=2840735 RepID=A0A9D2GP94_9BACT|nr:hypothetical protein [Candidatus Coprenecus stercoravium]
MQFKEVIGNEDLIPRLVRMVDGARTGHSLMFVEKDGYGALPLVMALIQYMVCQSVSRGNDSCGVCPSCRKVSAMMHPDVHFAFPVNVTAKSSQTKKPLSGSFMQDWRRLYGENPYFTEPDLYAALGIADKVGVISVAEAREILDSLSLKSYEGGGKYMVVWLPERMNAEAANRLLKMVEEPTPDTYFFFITHAPERVISTIRSRSQIIRLYPVRPEKLAEWLTVSKGIPKAEAAVYARISGGSPGLALGMASGDSASQVYLPVLERMLDNVVSGDLPALLEGNEPILALGREKQKGLCLYAEDFLRKMMMRGRGLERIADVLPSEADAVARFATLFQERFYERAFKAFEEARTCVESNVNAKMVFCNLVNILFALYNTKI